MVNGHTVITCVLVVQRSLAVIRPSQAFHDIMYMSNNAVCDFSDSSVQDMATLYIQTKLVAGEASLTPGAVVGFLEQFSLQGYTQGGVKDAQSVPIDLYATEGNKEPFCFHPPKLGDPPHTRELIDPLYHPLLLRPPSLQVRSCGL